MDERAVDIRKCQTCGHEAWVHRFVPPEAVVDGFYCCMTKDGIRCGCPNFAETEFDAILTLLAWKGV